MNSKFNIEHAETGDIPEIMPIFRNAVSYMRSCGNTDQWGDDYPSEEIIRGDIENGNFYKIMAGGEIAGVFALIFGEDSTYRIIDGGSWRTDKPYATVHRLASTGKFPGTARACFDFASSKYSYLRIDTHEKNTAMKRAVTDYGFKKCGIIYVADGTPRVAYDYIAPLTEK